MLTEQDLLLSLYGDVDTLNRRWQQLRDLGRPDLATQVHLATCEVYRVIAALIAAREARRVEASA